MHMPANNGGDYTPPPAGTHIALCHRIIDLGTQAVEWKGEKKFQRKVMLSWELPDEKMEDGRPFTISQRYTLSSHEKSRLRHDLESWRGKKFTDADFGPGGFNIKNVLGAPCFLSVTHESKGDKTYANISAIGKLPKGTPAPVAVNPQLYFSLDEPNWEIYEALSQGLRNVIATSPEYSEARTGATNDASPPPDENGDPGADPFGDDVPF